MSKSVTAIFNTSKSKDFAPSLKNENDVIYEYTESFKLLGVQFQTDSRKGITWEPYISNRIKCAYTNMWQLRRLAEMGVSTDKLVLIYKSKIRVHLEMNVPLWTFSLSSDLSKKLEKVQRISVLIILGQKSSKNYLSNLKNLKLDTLETRREILSKRFARKTLKHPVHRNIFKQKLRDDTRSSAPIILPKTKTARYMKSAVPSLAKIIVQNNYK